ncbi:MAG: diguanylate cyclase [Gammaproteobacteria bacterium]|nr:diguanylate cyclase [Gammaproteobacteria bacterium]
MHFFVNLIKNITNKFGSLISGLLGINMPEQWQELYSSNEHSLPIKQHRSELLSRRTKYFSLIFGIIVPAWSIVDYFLLPFDLWYKLALLRIISGFIFFSIAYECNKKELPLEKSRLLMAIMFMIPTVFFLIANPLLNGYHLMGYSGALINLYSLLPFLVIASLSIFTLTIKELVIITIPILFATFWYFYPQTASDIPDAFMMIWMFTLLFATSFFSSVSQMRYMISQVTRASYDSLTNAMTRRAGMDSLTLFFRMATLQDLPLSLLFIDLDDFKQLNDIYGHDAGDRALVEAVQNLKQCIRKGDSIIRWGGEEFIILLPQADHSDTKRILDRIIEIGLGERPDGKTLTASMGMTEMKHDGIKSWEAMVELADLRMYKAKQLGKGVCVGCQGKSLKLTK